MARVLLEAPEFDVDREIIEVASWRLVAELHRRFPGRFSITEMHPGGGTYDCLALYNNADGLYCQFNRPGSLAIDRPLAGPHPERRIYPIWPCMVSEGARRAVDAVTRLLGEEPSARLPRTTRATLTFRVMASMIQIAAFTDQAWQWRNGHLDTSGPGGCGPREHYFDPFDRLTERRREKRPHDPLGIPEYRFWFLVPGVDAEPVIALETTGVAYRRDGSVVDLMEAYRDGGRSITSVVGGLLAGIEQG